MDKLISKIISYLEYLNNDCKLSVSVHFDEKIFNCMPQHITTALLPYNSHTNAYCVLAKSINRGKCLANQKNLFISCKKDESLCTICHAGVYEYRYPILKNNEVAGYAAVSGYRTKNTPETNILSSNLWNTVLKEEIPLNLCETLIPPLCLMIEQLLLPCLKESVNEYNMIIQFLSEYHTNVSLPDLAKHFNRSKSHISHLFKSTNGQTIRAYCNNLKLEDARNLLINTDLPITEIALDTGFNDTSYFIHLFKTKYGISPLKYRTKKGM